MKCPELIKLLEETAPPEAAASWDNSGIQIPGTREEIKCLAVALDPSVANLEKALSFGADFVLCHHPLLFKPVFLHENANYACIVRMLMQAGVWLYSAHTSLDAQPVGPVRWLADELNLSGVCLLEPLQVGSPYGFGFCGDLPEPMQFDAFMQLLSVKMPVVQVRICGPRPGSVKRVACCPGSGSSLWPEALAMGADILITGDVKYHTALDSGICILDAGHFCLEEEMMRRFAAFLQLSLEGVEIKFIEAADPIRPYLFNCEKEL